MTKGGRRPPGDEGANETLVGLEVVERREEKEVVRGKSCGAEKESRPAT
jgi:hypothetical protein